MYGGGLKGAYGLRNPAQYGEWSPANLGSPSPNDYAGVMREIDQFNKLTREANHQTMIIEDEILDLQQKVYKLEVDSQKAKEEMIKRMISNDIVKQPFQQAATKIKPSAAHLPHTKPPIDNRSRGNTSSLHTLIKDSIRTLPGVTEFVKNSELLERFRKSYARDLQEYYKMNSSNLQRELVERSDTPGLSSYSEAVSQLYHQHSAGKPQIQPSAVAAVHSHNQTIKEADEQEEDGRLNHTSKDTSRPASVVSGRPKEQKDPRDAKANRDAQEPQQQTGKQPDEWDEKLEKALEEKMETKLLQNLRKNPNVNTVQSAKELEHASKVVGLVKYEQEGGSRIGTPQTQENRWLAKAGVQKGQTNTTHKTTSLREEDYATNFGQNDSDSGEPTPKTRTVQDHRSVDHQDDGLIEEAKDSSHSRYGTTNLLDSGKKVKAEVSPVSTKRLGGRIEDTASPNPQNFQTLHTLTASHKKEETITFKPHEVNSHSGKKATSERFTGNSELDPRRLGDEFAVPHPRAQPSKFAGDGPKKQAEVKRPNHVYKDSCFDSSDLHIEGEPDHTGDRDKPQNSFHQEDKQIISDSELKRVKREFEQIIEANKGSGESKRGERTEQGRKINHHDENIILEEDFGPELLTNPDMIGDGTRSQAIRHSKPLQDGSSLDYSHTRRFTEEGFRSNTDQQYGTGTLQSRRLGSGTQPRPDAPVPSKMLSDLSAKNDRLLDGTGVSQWKTPTGPTGSQFRMGISAEPEANSPISLQILDRERHILPGEIEKNYGFGASDVSLIKKKSEQREAPEDSRLDMFKDSAVGYEEYLERLKADTRGAKHKTVLEPIEEKTVPKQSGKQVVQPQQPQHPSRRTGTVTSGLLESEVSPRITGSAASKIVQSHKDSGIVANSGYPKTLPDSRAEHYIPFDEELLVDEDGPDSQLRGVSDALGKSSSKGTRTLMPIGAKMANSLDDLEEYIEGSASNLP